MAKMDGPLSITGPAVQLSKPEYAWEKIGFDVNEAPAVLVKNGRVFLTYSASATDANYALGMLTADASANLLDPAVWKKSPQPVFRSAQTASTAPATIPSPLRPMAKPMCWSITRATTVKSRAIRCTIPTATPARKSSGGAATVRRIWRARQRLIRTPVFLSLQTRALKPYACHNVVIKFSYPHGFPP
jgi:hypothetical protein